MVDRCAEREAIRDVALRYCRGIDRLDAACMRSAYWPDATDDHGTFVGSGWDFVDRCMLTHGRWRSTMHCIFNHSIEVSSGKRQATGEIYNVTYLFPMDGAGVHLWCGRYLDVYEKRDGDWRILKRICVHEGTALINAGAMPIEAQRFRQGSFDRAPFNDRSPSTTAPPSTT